MTAIKAYLLRLILCGFLVTLANALLRGRKGSRALALCGGCLLILTALRPLMRVDLSRLPDLITGLTRAEREAAAREKNDELLRDLVGSQTAEWIEARAGELGMDLKAEVGTGEAGAGTFVPVSAALSGSWTADQRAALSRLIEDELDIPPERQRWVGE